MDSMSDFDPYTKISEVLDDGRLVLTDVIGSGSFAVVYMAETVSTPKRRFAVKALFKHGLTSTQILLQRREAMLLKHLGTAAVRNASNKLTSNVKNNHIVNLEKMVETDDCIYLVMEWCQSDLYDVITNLANHGETMSEAAIKHLFVQLVDAVAFCHERGVSHRDLKPENVLIAAGDTPENFALKLTDFGLATTENWTTDYGCGSIRYMAPEALANDGSDRGYHPALNDVWSLGVILFNMVTGKNPWHTPSEDDFTFAEYFAAELDNKEPGHDRDAYFYKHFGVTMEASRLFGRIFRLDPQQRVRIQELKALVNGVEHFKLQSADVTAVEVQPVPAKSSESALSMHRWASETSEMDYSAIPAFPDSPAPASKNKAPQLVPASNETSPAKPPVLDTVSSGPHYSINKQGDLLPPRGPANSNTTHTKQNVHRPNNQRQKRPANGSARHRIAPDNNHKRHNNSGPSVSSSSMHQPVMLVTGEPVALTASSSSATSPRRARRRYQRNQQVAPTAPVVVTSCQAAVAASNAAAVPAPPSTPTVAMAEGAAAAMVQAMPYRRVIQDAASALRKIAAMFEDGRSSTAGSAGAANASISAGAASMAGRMTAAV